jgi:hypothetical protein
MHAALTLNRRIPGSSGGSLAGVWWSCAGGAVGYTLANNRPNSIGETRPKFGLLQRAGAVSACPTADCAASPGEPLPIARSLAA